MTPKTLQKLKQSFENKIKVCDNILKTKLSQDAYKDYCDIKTEHENVLELINEKIQLDDL